MLFQSFSLYFFSLPDEEKRLNFCFKRTTTHLVLFFPRVPLSLLYNIRASVYTTYSNSCNKFCRERTDGRMCVNCSITLASQFLWVLRTKQNKTKRKKEEFLLVCFHCCCYCCYYFFSIYWPLSSNRRFPQN